MGKAQQVKQQKHNQTWLHTVLIGSLIHIWCSSEGSTGLNHAFVFMVMKQTCHPVPQFDALMFFSSLSVTTELCGKNTSS